ncbi:IclR family transcriptional regulator [Nocardioides daejeonensis]|uniref:IclR family transcriptional regulator n=1 Tax=Nocardioides daejeonensis TaxID=1046556 RepID=UPI00194E681B|nr:IclR family transcriptional regulator [Nocardioides daejeonensis]
MTTMPVDLSTTAITRGAADDRSPRPGVVERLTQILDVFTHATDRLLLDDITDATGLPRSTAFRLLTQMVELDWLEHDVAGYQLGARALRIGMRGHDHSNVRAAAADQLNVLQLRTGGVAHLSVLEGSSVHYLDKVGGQALASIPSAVGSRLRADTTASGRALLAGIEPESVDAMFTRFSTPPGELSALHRMLVRVRQQHGLSITRPEVCRLGIGTVAAPVLGPQGPVAAISVALRGGPRIDQIAPLVAHAARRTSQILFPNWTPPTTRRRGR